MPEKIEASLNWPQTGLAGVPESEGGLTFAPPASPAAPPADVVEREPATNGKTEHVEETVSAGGGVPSLYDGTLQQGVETIAQAVRELTASLQEMRTTGDTAYASVAEASLARIETAASGVSVSLERINGLLRERLNRFNAQLAFGSNVLSETDSSLLTHSLYQDEHAGPTPESEGVRVSAVNWPPWGPTRKRSVWSRMARSNIAIPLLLLAVIAVSAAAYKVYEHETKPTIVPGVSAQGVTADGSVKVVDGPVCKAGSSSTTIQLAAAQEASGVYYVAASGSVTNSGSAALHNMIVHWTVTYADGSQFTQSEPANKAQPIPGKSTKSWFAIAPTTDGSVPPVSVAIGAVSASPTLPACS